jgi:hypothetical protein
MMEVLLYTNLTHRYSGSFCNSSGVFAVDLIEWLSIRNWFGNIPFLETGLQVLKVIANNL